MISRSVLRAVICGCLGWAPVASRGGELPASFTLGRFVPADTWLYIHTARNPERVWIERQWSEFYDALLASGIDGELKELILSSMSDPQQRAQFSAVVEKVTALIKGVDWKALWQEELVFAERLAAKESGPEYLALARGAAGKGGANLAGLVAILKEATSVLESVALNRVKRGALEVWRLERAGGGKGGFILALVRKGDVIGLAFGRQMLEEALSLIEGGEGPPAITSSSRFRKALAQVSAPQDELVYFDMRLFLRNLCGKMQRCCEAERTSDRGGKPAARIVHALAERLDVIDYIIASKRTEGRREITEELTRLQAGKQNDPLVQVFLDRKRFTDFDRFVPADATGFSLSASINLQRLYGFILKLIEKEAEGGRARVERWNRLLADIGVDLDRDLFSWFSGEYAYVELPAAAVSPMGGGEWVVMLRVKDEALARKKIDAAVAFVHARLQEHGQTLLISPAPVDAEGFKQVTHPMLMMFFRPVVGVKGEWLWVGSSPSSINTCLAVASGTGPSILKNERFRREGLTPDGPVLGVSFSDMTDFGQEWAAGLGMVGAFGGMVTASIPQETKEAAAAMRVVQKLLGMAAKLAPVFQKLDFFSAQATTCRYDGELNIRSHCVITYKEPTQPQEAAAATGKSR